MFLADQWSDYRVLDTGDGEKLERWGDVLLARPDPQVIWPKSCPDLWEKADARYERSDRGGGSWRFAKPLQERWTVSYKDLTFFVRPTGFKHTGLFPEQAANWDFMRSLVRGKKGIRILNLFAYTGGATVALAKEGAQVTHVDAAKGMTQWAKENRDVSGVPVENTRFIVEDALQFVRREIRRGNTYHGILMDPPSYGRGPNGEVWKLEDEMFGLVSESACLLSDDALFFVLNSYTTGFQASVLTNVLNLAVRPYMGGSVQAEELCLPVKSGGILPCGCTGRITKER